MYLASVKAAQHELDCSSGATPLQRSTGDTVLGWPGSSLDHDKLASLRAALAAVGLDSTAQDRQQHDLPSTAAAEPDVCGVGLSAPMQCSSEITGQDEDFAADNSCGIAGGAVGASATVIDSFDLALADSWASANADTLSDGDGQHVAMEGAPAALVSQGTTVACSEAAAASTDIAASSGATAHPEDVVIDLSGAKLENTTAAPRLYDLD